MSWEVSVFNLRRKWKPTATFLVWFPAMLPALYHLEHRARSFLPHLPKEEEKLNPLVALRIRK